MPLKKQDSKSNIIGRIEKYVQDQVIGTFSLVISFSCED